MSTKKIDMGETTHLDGIEIDRIDAIKTETDSDEHEHGTTAPR